MNGIREKNFEFQTVIDIYTKYEALGLVPTHYNFPEFYRYWPSRFALIKYSYKPLCAFNLKKDKIFVTQMQFAP